MKDNPNGVIEDKNNALMKGNDAVSIPERVLAIKKAIGDLKNNLLGLQEDLLNQIDLQNPNSIKQASGIMADLASRTIHISASLNGLSKWISERFSMEQYHVHQLEQLRIRKRFSLEGTFRAKNLYGFALDGVPGALVRGWHDFIMEFAYFLSKRSEELFCSLPTDDRLVWISGKNPFSFKEENLKKPSHVACGVYVETEMPASHIGPFILCLLEMFGIPHEQIEIYLQ